MRRKRIILMAEAAAFALAAAVVVMPPVEGADAYFTTYTGAAGGRTLHVGSRPDIEEEFSGWPKTVTVSNAEGSAPVYVRARGFAGSEYSLVYLDETNSWTVGGDGFYYYNAILNAGEATSPLQVGIGGIPEGEESFNVAVVYECTPVQYRADGTPYADWEIRLEPLGTVSE